MIKLTQLLEHESEPKPYMYSPVGFSCAVCKYLNFNKEEDTYTCGSTHYQEYAGTHILKGEDGKPLTKDLLKKYCSNWFEPKS
jgi:hypothetical protein